ncbi:MULTISPECIES: DUF2993 domain-containing protein [unclassified Okeania]|uniref:LmeA family phospholipid-binding protein n=1 Tax=unclassified Okeania TaxID=2634635 RepID=UPI0013BE6341|nr:MULTISPECIES: DUF2993 domain-containing protein [unclassified Okeania]NEP05776.1 DUF2993 domain-containing protein [Okeania sp. SIO4D6]NEP39996.1 DUF2993 domain-containing protein [Okeania sp. SIO2H7]NET14588.1 DUF2993 domain-containing protein [Okeania sp. SIO1H6]NEP73242.1 DUF2993 domain-containing protein [Okeania sp. SIO2G5]NEP90180.1 DUF2993 domain-containing protein [Okeania sp. SIO2C2]
MVTALLTNVPMQNQSGDRLVSKAAGAAIAALFKSSDKVEANVRAEPVAKLLQGSLDGFDFIGKGMRMYNGLRIEVMELYLQAVSIDFSAIFTGKVKLRQPIQATLRTVLTESDLTTSFNTPFVIEKLQRLKYQGQSLHFQNTQMTITEDRALRLKTQIGVGNPNQPIDVDFTANIEVENRRKIKFVNVKYNGDRESVDLGKSLIDHVNNLLDLDKFALENTQLRVDRLRVGRDDITFYGIAKIEQFPSGMKNK